SGVSKRCLLGAAAPVDVLHESADVRPTVEQRAAARVAVPALQHLGIASEARLVALASLPSLDVSTCLCGRGHSGRPEATHDVEPLLDEAPCATADPPVDGRHVTPEAIEVPRHEVRGDGLHSPPLEFVLEVLYAF